MLSFDDPRFKKPLNQWTREDILAWEEIEIASRVIEEDPEADAEAEQWVKEQEDKYQAMREELEDLEAMDNGDECISYRIQCLNADIFAYEQAKAAYERGDEYMPENPYEAGLG